MAVTVAAVGWMAASAVVSGVMSNRQRNNRNIQAIENAAYRDAAIDANIQIQREGLTAQSYELFRAQSENQRRIDNAHEATAAAQRVEAAASGTTGGSIDLTQTAIQHRAGSMQGEVARAYDVQMNNLDRKFRNIGVSGELSKQEVITDDKMSGEGLANLIQNIARMQIGFSLGQG